MSLQIFFINVSIIFFSLFKLVVFFFKIGWTHLQPFASRPQLPNSVSISPNCAAMLARLSGTSRSLWRLGSLRCGVFGNFEWLKQATNIPTKIISHTILHMLITSYPIRIICSSKTTPDLLEEIAWNSWSPRCFLHGFCKREHNRRELFIILELLDCLVCTFNISGRIIFFGSHWPPWQQPWSSRNASITPKVSQLGLQL